MIELASHEVLHLKALSTNGRMGRSVLQDMRESIGGAIAAQAFGNALWDNDATPRVALEHPDTLSEPAQDRLERFLRLLARYPLPRMTAAHFATGV